MCICITCIYYLFILVICLYMSYLMHHPSLQTSYIQGCLEEIALSAQTALLYFQFFQLLCNVCFCCAVKYTFNKVYLYCIYLLNKDNKTRIYNLSNKLSEGYYLFLYYLHMYEQTVTSLCPLNAFYIIISGVKSHFKK